MNKEEKICSENQRLMFRFFSRKSSREENDRLAEWIGQNPERQEELNKAFSVFAASYLLAPMRSKQIVRSKKTLRISAFVTSVAAALAVGIIFSNHFIAQPLRDQIDSTVLISETEPGLRSEVVLSDGSKICLNSGSKVEYPAIFGGKERRIRLQGEAMFDVVHDEKHPFIVETFAYDVKVLGTRFDVLAREEKNEFSTALLSGKVLIQDKNENALVVMSPGSVVSLDGDILISSHIGSMDSYLWTEGVISATGLPFDELMKVFERCYGREIVIEREDLPEIKYSYLKFRISDGIEHALNILRRGSNFEYTFNESKDTYYIK